MKDVRITVMRKALYRDLMEKYEGGSEYGCELEEGQVFISRNSLMPEGMCQSAWSVLYPYVLGLAGGADDYFDGWMKEKGTAMISCADGFRPVTFYLEAGTF